MNSWDSPWENGYVESYSGKPRDELLEREAFGTLLKAKVLIERWRQHYNMIRPHRALGYRPQRCGTPVRSHGTGLLEAKILTQILASFHGGKSSSENGPNQASACQHQSLSSTMSCYLRTK